MLKLHEMKVNFGAVNIITIIYKNEICTIVMKEEQESLINYMNPHLIFTS